jgi:starch phosphorylase
VEIVFGRTDDADILHDARRAVLTAGASAGGVTHYRGSIPLERPGGFGYTVRVVPEHAGLVSPVELGLVHVPTESAAFG